MILYHVRHLCLVFCHVYLALISACSMLNAQYSTLYCPFICEISYHLSICPCKSQISTKQRLLCRVPPHQKYPDSQSWCHHAPQVPSDCIKDPISLPTLSCPLWPPRGSVHGDTLPPPADRECVREGPRPRGRTDHGCDGRGRPRQGAPRKKVRKG